MKVSIKKMVVSRLSLGNDIPQINRIIDLQRASMVEPDNGKWKVYKMNDDLRRRLSEMLADAEVLHTADSRDEALKWELNNII